MRDLLYCAIIYLDTQLENSYHCFYLGCFETALGNLQGFIVKSNRESGKGRFDIVVAVEGLRWFLIFELKLADSEQQLQDKAMQAMRQAVEGNYAAEFGEHLCYVIGISFCKKVMSKLEVLLLGQKDFHRL